MDDTDGGAAFPRPHSVDEFNEVRYHGQDGMSLRDHYAGLAMQGVISDGRTMWDNPAFQAEPEAIADFAFRMADAMLAARSKP